MKGYAPFDPVEKIASVLESAPKNQGYVQELEVPKQLMVAGYYLGQQIDRTRLLQSLSSEPSVEAAPKLILLNLAKIIGGRIPGPNYPLEMVRRGTQATFLEEILESRENEQTQTQAPKKTGPYQYQDTYHRHLGLDPDLKLAADDIYGIVKKAAQMLPYVHDFDDLVFLASACIYSEGIEEKQIKDSVDRYLASADAAPAGAFSAVYLHYSKDLLRRMEEVDAPKVFANNSKVGEAVDAVRQMLALECNLRYPGMTGMVYDIEKTVGTKFNRILYLPEGLAIDFSYHVTHAEPDELLTLIKNAGIGSAEEAERVLRTAVTIPYRDFRASVDIQIEAFTGFCDGLAEKVLRTRTYDPDDKDFRKGDLVMPVHPFGIIRYRHQDSDFTPETFPPGTIARVVQTQGTIVTVEREGKDDRRYDFDTAELAKAGPVPVEPDEQAKRAMKEKIKPIIDGVRLTNRFLFDPDRYLEILRMGIIQLNSAGLDEEEIRDVIDLRGRGISGYDRSEAIREWTTGRTGPKDYPTEDLPDEPHQRVAEIFRRHPTCFPYSGMCEADEPKKSLAYLLMPDSNTSLVHDHLMTDHPISGFVLSYLAVEHTNDIENIPDALDFPALSLQEIIDECAISSYQTIAGVQIEKIRGMKRSRMHHMRGDPLRAMLEELVETREEDQTGSADDSYQGSRGLHLLGDDHEDSMRQNMHRAISTLLGIGPKGNLMKRSGRPIQAASNDPSALLGYELFKGLKDGVDMPGAVQLYMDMIGEHAGLLAFAKDVPDLRYILGASYFLSNSDEHASGFWPKEESSAHEILIRSILLYIENAIDSAGRRMQVW